VVIVSEARASLASRLRMSLESRHIYFGVVRMAQTLPVHAPLGIVRAKAVPRRRFCSAPMRPKGWASSIDFSVAGDAWCSCGIDMAVLRCDIGVGRDCVLPSSSPPSVELEAKSDQSPRCAQRVAQSCQSRFVDSNHK
jgi:hypothetical protein